jgi:hypothetical protein
MSDKQKKLLYEIAELRSKRFFNDMNDHWSLGDAEFDAKCSQKIDELEEQYKSLYGDLPEWKYINDVWETMEELRECVVSG